MGQREISLKLWKPVVGRDWYNKKQQLESQSHSLVLWLNRQNVTPVGSTVISILTQNQPPSPSQVNCNEGIEDFHASLPDYPETSILWWLNVGSASLGHHRMNVSYLLGWIHLSETQAVPACQAALHIHQVRTEVFFITPLHVYRRDRERFYLKHAPYIFTLLVWLRCMIAVFNIYYYFTSVIQLLYS